MEKVEPNKKPKKVRIPQNELDAQRIRDSIAIQKVSMK